MQDLHKKRLKVALPGMDGRTQKTLTLFIQGPCKSAGVDVVDGNDADVDIIDFDLPGGKEFLNKKQTDQSDIPSIILSLKDVNPSGSDSTLYLKKPVTREGMLDVLHKAKLLVLSYKKISASALPADTNLLDEQPVTPESQMDLNETMDSTQLKHYVRNVSDKDKTSKHKTAMQMDEKSFSAYMGVISSLDLARPAELKQAFYNPRDYFQGYVQSAIKVASARGQVLELNSGWKQLLIFPHSNEIWLDADDKQLRAFAGISINKNGSQQKSMSVSPLNPKAIINHDPDKFHSCDALAWKLACWTSKGRYPQQIDIDLPVFLKHWPNFTRLLATPHALRIAALLIEKPRTAVSIAKALNIKPEYVFIFISAASAIGLLGQTTRNADSAVAPPPEIKPNKKHSLFNRIISKLRANKE